MTHIKIYLHSIKILMRSRMQYRTSFLLQWVATVAMSGGQLFAIVMLLNRFQRLGQWSPGEVIFFFGIMEMSFCLVEMFGSGFRWFGTNVRNGNFDTMLLRPRAIAMTVLCSELDSRRVLSILIGLAALIYGGIVAHVAWNAANIVCLLIALISGGSLILGLFMLEATLTFWSVQSIQMISILTYGGRTSCQYPLDIYPSSFRWVFLYVVPYGLTTHLPVAYILGKPLLTFPAWSAFVLPWTGVLFMLLMLCVWHIGVRHYRSTGS